MTTPKPMSACWLGERPYAPMHEMMAALAEARRQGQIDDTLLLLEHEPVITLGRGAKAANVLGSSEQLAESGVTLIETGRGGDVTLHAPGQLVAYPILDLSPDRKDVRKYVQGLTRIMQKLVLPFGIDGGTVQDLIGLWIDRESPHHYPGESAAENLAKLGAIGVRISRWVTSHGFALNLTTDLSLFGLIIPCGIQEHGVTSLLQLTGEPLSTRAAAERAVPLFCEEFDRAPSDLLDLSSKATEGLDQHVFDLVRSSGPD